MIETVNDMLLYIDNYQVTHGITDYQISKAAGIDRGALSRWKTGEREPTVRSILKVLDALDLEVTLKSRGDNYEQVEILHT